MVGSGLLVGMVSTGLWHNIKSIQKPCQNADATSPHLSNLEHLDSVHRPQPACHITKFVPNFILKNVCEYSGVSSCH